MRALALIPFLSRRGCGEAPAENKAAPAAAALAPGQWELDLRGHQLPQGRSRAMPRIDTPVGTRATQSLCVGRGPRAPDRLLRRRGLSLQLRHLLCPQRPGEPDAELHPRGPRRHITMAAEGTFQADSVEFRRNCEHEPHRRAARRGRGAGDRTADRRLHAGRGRRRRPQQAGLTRPDERRTANDRLCDSGHQRPRPRRAAYYDALFGAIGAGRLMEFGENFTLYGTGWGSPASPSPSPIMARRRRPATATWPRS